MAYEEVRQLNQLGVQLGIAGDFDGAHRTFAEALPLLTRDLSNAEVTDLIGNIRRDDAFAYTREAALSSDVEQQRLLLNQAQLGLGIALKDVDRVITRDDWARGQGHELPILSNTDKASLHANRAATIGLVARTHTVAAVLDQQAHNGRLVNREAHRSARTGYTEAYKGALKGNNGYYRTSIAITGAQHEIIFGSYFRLCQWIGRAASSLAWTFRNDRENLRAASRTFGRRFMLLGELAVKPETLLDSP